MLTGIQVYSEVGTLVLTLPVVVHNQSGPFIVRDIDGLDPVKAEVVTTTNANVDGGRFQSARAGMRNIVMKIGYHPNYAANQTVDSLRRELYGYFPPKGAVRLRFISNNLKNLELTGYVESHEVPMFGSDTQVQISILCPDPYFTDLSSRTITGINNVWSPMTILGDAPTGFVFNIGPLPRALPYIWTSNRLNSGVSFYGDFRQNDSFSYSTIRGDKYVRRTRLGTTTSALNDLSSGSLASVLDSRTVDFKVTTDGASDIQYTLTYTPKYLGI